MKSFLLAIHLTLVILVLEGCQAVQPEPVANLKEMVYASNAAGIAALEVNPSDGTLRQVDFLAGPAGGGMSVLPNGHYLLTGFSGYGFGHEIIAVKLTPDGRFATEPQHINLRGALGLSADGRFLFALQNGPPFNEREDYHEYLKTYRLDESEDSLRLVEVASYDQVFCTNFCYEAWEFRGVGESGKGPVLWLNHYIQSGLTDTASYMEGYVIDSEDGSLLKQYDGFYGYGAGGKPFKNYLVGTDSGWDPMVLFSFDVDRPDSPLWVCDQSSASGTSGFRGCDANDAQFDHAGDRIYFANGYQPTQLWSMPFSAAVGPDYDHAILMNDNTNALQMISTSRDTDFLVIEGDATCCRTELRVYHIKPASGSPIQITSQPVFENIYSLAVH